MAASTTVANFNDGETNVDITFTQLEHDYDRTIAVKSIPQSLDSANTTPLSSVSNPLNLNIDLLYLKQQIKITGFLLDELSESALTKKDKLEKIMSGGTANSVKTVTLTWKVGAKTITKKGSIAKCKITEKPYRVGGDSLQGTQTARSANKIVDSNAKFSTNGVAINQTIYNLGNPTNGPLFTAATIISVDSETQLTLDTDIFTKTANPPTTLWDNYVIGLGTKTFEVNITLFPGVITG